MEVLPVEICRAGIEWICDYNSSHIMHDKITWNFSSSFIKNNLHRRECFKLSGIYHKLHLTNVCLSILGSVNEIISFVILIVCYLEFKWRIGIWTGICWLLRTLTAFCWQQSGFWCFHQCSRSAFFQLICGFIYNSLLAQSSTAHFI